MGGGGKGGGTSVQSPPPSYVDPVTGRTYSSPDQLNAAISAREAQEKQAAETAAAEAEAKRIADLAGFNTRLDSAYNQSQDNINQYFSSLGLDPTQYAAQITNRLNTQRSQVPQLDPNPYAVFGDNLGQSIVNELTGAAQSRGRTQLDSLFGQNYSANELPLHLVDPVIQQILGERISPLQDQLTNAQLRGTLNDKGMSGALEQLNQDRTAGQSTLSRLGTNVLMGDRGEVDNYLSGVYNTASTMPLLAANTFDPNQYYNEAESRTDRYRSNLYGDTLNALGNTQFSDITKLLNAGGVAQGPYDPTIENPIGGVSAGALAQNIINSQNRGLGTQGQF